MCTYIYFLLRTTTKTNVTEECLLMKCSPEMVLLQISSRSAFHIGLFKGNDWCVHKNVSRNDIQSVTRE